LCAANPTERGGSRSMILMLADEAANVAFISDLESDIVEK
jgi:hypothetical protein